MSTENGSDESLLWRQAAREADRMAAEHDRAIRAGFSPVPRREAIADQPRHLYRHPWHLERTAPDLVGELDDLLEEMWATNQAHVGEKTLEVHGYYVATGYGDDLEERFRVWFDAYARRRADPDRLHPGILSDPFVLWLKVNQEMAGLYDRFGNRESTLNSWFLNLGFTYSSWLATRLLVRPNVKVWPDGGGFSTPVRPADPELAALAAERLETEARFADDLGRYVSRHSATAGGEDPGHTADGWRSRLAALAADIQAMRPFLIRGYQPRRTLVRLSPDAWGAWVYCGSMGGVIGRVVTGASSEQVLRHVAGHTTDLAVSVNRRGLLCVHALPWLKADGLEGAEPLRVNHAVLSRVHARLFELFDRVDLARARPRARAGADEQAVEVACLDLARQEPAGPVSEPGAPVRLIPALRFSRLTRHLARWFGCEVEAGKGSEVKVYRPGRPIFTLGRHKADFEVHPGLVRRLLRRLGIPADAWAAAVYREL